MAYGVWRKARGALLRALPIAALVLAVADPELVTETHNPLKDIAVVVVRHTGFPGQPSADGRAGRTSARQIIGR